MHLIMSRIHLCHFDTMNVTQFCQNQQTFTLHFVDDRITAYHRSKSLLHVFKAVINFTFLTQLNFYRSLNETIVTKIVLGWALDFEI